MLIGGISWATRFLKRKARVSSAQAAVCPGWVGGWWAGSRPFPQRYPERMGEIRNNWGKGRRRGFGRAVPGLSRDGDSTWDPSPMGHVSLLFPSPHRPHMWARQAVLRLTSRVAMPTPLLTSVHCMERPNPRGDSYGDSYNYPTQSWGFAALWVVCRGWQHVVLRSPCCTIALKNTEFKERLFWAPFPMLQMQTPVSSSFG